MTQTQSRIREIAEDRTLDTRAIVEACTGRDLDPMNTEDAYLLSVAQDVLDRRDREEREAARHIPEEHGKVLDWINVYVREASEWGFRRVYLLADESAWMSDFRAAADRPMPPAVQINYIDAARLVHWLDDNNENTGVREHRVARRLRGIAP